MTEPLFWIQSLFSLHYISLPLPCGQEEQNGNKQNPCSLDISHLNQVETLAATSWVRLSPSGRRGGRPQPSTGDFLQPQLRCLWGCALQKSVWEKVSRCFQREQPVGLLTSPLPYLFSCPPPRQRTDLPLVIKHGPVTPQQENTWASLGLQDPFLFLFNSPLIYQAEHPHPPSSPPHPTQRTKCCSSGN